MDKVKITLPTLNDIKEFNKITLEYDFEVDLAAGNYVVDAKSIMGIFSLDTNEKLELRIHSDNHGDYLEKIGKFLA